MLDDLYINIGAKIKTWAKWIFIIEAISAIIGGIGFIVNDDGGIGFVIMVFGPLLAWVSSWLLYAFGELDEDVHALRNKEEGAKESAGYGAEKNDESFTKIVNALKESAPVTTGKDPNKGNAPISAEIKAGEKICPKCGTAQRADRCVCWNCGQPFDN